MIIFSLMIHAMANAQLSNLSTTLAVDSFRTVAEAKATAKAVVSKAKAEKFVRKNANNAASVTWSIDGQSMHASYKENSVQTRIAFNKNGGWFRTIKTYDADSLIGELQECEKAVQRLRDYCINEVKEVACIVTF